MRLYYCIPAMLAAFLLTAVVATSRAETPQRYQIEVKLTATSRNGHKTILCNPSVGVVEGEEADALVGQAFGPLEGVMAEPMLTDGWSCKLKVVHKKERLFLDATASYSSSGISGEDEAETTTTSMHIVKSITLGKKITVPAMFAGGRWELLVQEWSPQKPSEIGSEKAFSKAAHVSDHPRASAR